MTQQELADASGVSLRTIIAFESPESRRLTRVNLKAIEEVFKGYGVIFYAMGLEWAKFRVPAEAMSS